MIVTVFAVETDRYSISEESFLTSDYELALLKAKKFGEGYSVYEIEFDLEVSEVKKVS